VPQDLDTTTIKMTLFLWLLNSSEKGHDCVNVIGVGIVMHTKK